MCAFAADEFRSCARGDYESVADTVVFKPHWHRHFFKVHADHCQSDVKSRVGSYMFQCDGVVQRMIAGCCKRAARFRKRNNVHNIGIADCRAFSNYCAVEMLTALRRNKNAVFVTSLFYAVKKRLCRFGT